MKERETVSVPLSAAQRNFGRFAWGVLFWNLLVIAVGTFVRATKSGDGCGSHWPVCNGHVVPPSPTVATMIEYTHRLVSGVDGLLVLGMLIGAFLLFRGHTLVKRAAVVSFLLTLLEAFIGAVLVKKGYVAENKSVARAVVMSLHLVSTFALLAALTLTAWWASGKERVQWRGQGAMGWGLAGAFLGMLLLGVSGAVTALGDTLYPVQSHEEVLRLAAQPDAPFLLRLRILHPYIAGSVGLYLILMAGLTTHLRPSVGTQRGAELLGGVFIAQIVVGFVNLWLKAPVWMQIIHLLMADFTWIALLYLMAAAFAPATPRLEWTPMSAREERNLASAGLPAPTWRDYVALTKPRVISLLLLTTLTAMFMAAGGFPGFWLLIAVSLGGYGAAGAANCINMVIDRDIDHRMERTAKRPTVAATIPAPRALAFGMTLAVFSFGVLWLSANLLTAMLSLAGLVFYIIVYTLVLKRRTWHNIVIGGAAGAFPPLVGWAAVTNSLAPLAWYLFAIVFVWTPAHFWALALLIKEEYAEAGVPMAPLVIGERATVIQIALYSVLTAVVSLLPLAQGLVGWGYVIAAALLNLDLIRRSLMLFKNTERKTASGLFHYSMAYLALLFIALAVDRSF